MKMAAWRSDGSATISPCGGTGRTSQGNFWFVSHFLSPTRTLWASFLPTKSKKFRSDLNIDFGTISYLACIMIIYIPSSVPQSCWCEFIHTNRLIPLTKTGNEITAYFDWPLGMHSRGSFCQRGRISDSGSREQCSAKRIAEFSRSPRIWWNPQCRIHAPWIVPGMKLPVVRYPLGVFHLILLAEGQAPMLTIYILCFFRETVIRMMT